MNNGNAKCPLLYGLSYREFSALELERFADEYENHNDFNRLYDKAVNLHLSPYAVKSGSYDRYDFRHEGGSRTCPEIVALNLGPGPDGEPQDTELHMYGILWNLNTLILGGGTIKGSGPNTDYPEVVSIINRLEAVINELKRQISQKLIKDHMILPGFYTGTGRRTILLDEIQLGMI